MKNSFKWSSAVSVLILFVSSAAAQTTPEKPAGQSDGTASAVAAINSSGDRTEIAPYQWADIGEPVYKGGGSVRPPVAIHTPDPKFSREAVKAKFSGNVVVAMIVDSHGKPRDVHVLRGLGIFGLDDNAMEAVKKYRFKPALDNGKPIAVYLNVEVNFIFAGPH